MTLWSSDDIVIDIIQWQYWYRYLILVLILFEILMLLLLTIDIDIGNQYCWHSLIHLVIGIVDGNDDRDGDDIDHCWWPRACWWQSDPFILFPVILTIIIDCCYSFIDPSIDPRALLTTASDHSIVLLILSSGIVDIHSLKHWNRWHCWPYWWRWVILETPSDPNWLLLFIIGNHYHIEAIQSISDSDPVTKSISDQ